MADGLFLSASGSAVAAARAADLWKQDRIVVEVLDWEVVEVPGMKPDFAS